MSENGSGQTWAVGSIVNGHVLSQNAGWVRLNPRVNGAGPWRSGDVINGHAFTGHNWVPLPPGWWPPAVQVPTYQPEPPRTPQGFLNTANKVLSLIYCGFWFIIAAYSASVAQAQDEPRFLLLTSTASLNIVLYLVTGKTRGELRQSLRGKVRAMLPLLFYGTIAMATAAGGVWLSIHFDEPGILVWTLFVVLVGAAIAWVFH